MDSLRLPAAARPSSMGSTDFGEVAALVTAYTDYLQALTGLCGRGVQLIRNFVGPCSVAYMLPTKEREEAQKLWAIWEDINKSMQQSVWSVRTQSVQSLQDWLQQKSKEDKLQDSSKSSHPDDLSKLITACLVAFTQLQYQFSALCCHSFMELDLVKVDEGSSDMSGGGGALSLLCESEIDKERRDSGNVSDDLAPGNSMDPLLTQLQLGRRSSYELGNLHTASPPPPSANSLGRRWSMPTEDIVLHEHKVSPQFNGVLEKKRESFVSHEELDSVINLLSFNHGVSAPPSKSSNFGVKSLSPASKLDVLAPPSRCPHTKYGVHPRHEQPPLDTRSWSSSKNCVPNSSNGGGGLLTVASMVSSDCQEAKHNRKNFDIHLPGNNSTSSAKLSCTNQQQQQPPIMMSLGGLDGGVNNEGAFSIGLNLVGNDLMASVQQRQINNEEMKSNLPQLKVPETNGKQIRIQSSLEASWSSSDPGYKDVEIQSPAEFLPFSLNASPGPSIWTPSQSDYTSPGGNYYFPVGP